jgi:hypothetical protein
MLKIATSHHLQLGGVKEGFFDKFKRVHGSVDTFRLLAFKRIR